jgi:arsenate reductase-like glutaredoxin family protein
MRVDGSARATVRRAAGSLAAMPRITRAYLRKNCTSCDRARGYFGDRLDAVLQSAEVLDARKVAVGPDEIPGWLKGRKRLVVAKGQKWFDLRLADLDQDERDKLLIGPSGKLRAPALVVGDALVVGFHAAAYDAVFG